MVLRSPALEALTWLRHGFGTRDEPLSQDGMAVLEQVHSALVLETVQPGCAGQGDALITDRPGVTLSVRTADCFPILLVDSRKRAVAVVHAGWRGTDSRIVAETVKKMRVTYGSSPADLWAAIGPGIGACCYQVGAEVASKFGLKQAGPLDLAEINRRQMIDAGIPQAQIDLAGGCTRCLAAQFHSYRRDQEQAGRQISYVGIASR